MVLSNGDKNLIKALRQEKGFLARKLIAEFPNKTSTLSDLSYTYKKIEATAQ